MGRVQPIRNLNRQVQKLARLQGLIFDAVFEGLSFQQLHGNEGLPWREMWYALDRQVSEEKQGRAFPAVPVCRPAPTLRPAFFPRIPGSISVTGTIAPKQPRRLGPSSWPSMQLRPRPARQRP